MSYIKNFGLWVAALIGVWNGEKVSNTTRWGIVLLAAALGGVLTYYR